MTKQEVAVRLLKAIFLEVISIALILIGYVISGGENNGVTTFLIVLGLILFFIGGFMGGVLRIDNERKLIWSLIAQ